MSYEIRNDKLLREAYESGRRQGLNEQGGGGGAYGPPSAPPSAGFDDNVKSFVPPDSAPNWWDPQYWPWPFGTPQPDVGDEPDIDPPLEPTDPNEIPDPDLRPEEPSIPDLFNPTWYNTNPYGINPDRPKEKPFELPPHLDPNYRHPILTPRSPLDPRRWTPGRGWPWWLQPGRWKFPRLIPAINVPKLEDVDHSQNPRNRRNQMNLNEQLRQAYDAGKRQGLNELSPGHPQINHGGDFGGGGPGGQKPQRWQPGYADYLPDDSGHFAHLGWEWMAEFLGMTPEEFQAMWTSVGVDPNFDWGQFGFTQGANGAWSYNLNIPGMPWASIIISWNTSTGQWVFWNTIT
jgi:hypothetical protein